MPSPARTSAWKKWGNGLSGVYFGPLDLGRMDERTHRIEDHQGRTVRKVLPMSPD